MDMLTLYQFPHSHYSEKTRWALEYKKIPYKIINLVPGLHLFTTKKLAPKTSVPIIVHKGKVIQDSTTIFDYLDEAFPEKPLTPSDPALKKEALELEEWLDDAVGDNIRRIMYYHLLPHKKLTLSLLLRNSAWYVPTLYSLFYPLFVKMFRKRLNITQQTAIESEKKLTEALEKLNEKIKGKQFLIGDHFTRADITAASLLALLCNPYEHSYQWPSDKLMPEPLIAYKKAHIQDPICQWVLKMYREWRIH